MRVAGGDVVLAPARGGPRAPRPAAPADLAMLIGIAFVVNRLVARARQSQDAAERAAARERHVRQERERVVATVAHDLATPLTAASGTLQFARRFGLAPEHDERRLLRRLETATARATSLVRTLTDVEDLGAVRPERMRSVDLREIVRPITEMMQGLSERHPVILTLPDDPVVVDADTERLQRVMENLLNNAVKFSPDGGRIDVSVRCDGGVGTVVVRDHGIGVAPEARTRIFDLSYRAPEAKQTAPGRGLGLHIAAHIVAAHGGAIEAQAAAGGGTAILVRLPLARDGASTSGGLPHDGASSTSADFNAAGRGRITG
jgi:signal transduction histidine kinase